jgi:FixJ family two-component response regulator
MRARVPPEPPSPRKAATTEPEVLVVDDDEMVLESTTLVVRSFGVRARAESSPQAALALVRANPRRFALVITDMTMPEMNGDELATELKSLAPLLPVVIVSGNRDPVEPGLFEAVLPKPFQRHALAELVERCVRSSWSAAPNEET